MSVTYDPIRKIWTGPKEPHWLNPLANLGPAILNLLERTPTRIAQVSVESGVAVTCEQIRLRSIRAAQNLTSLGYGKGDVVGFAVLHRENVAPVVYGCFLIGAPVSCLDTDCKVNDIAHMFGITKPVLVIADEDNVETVKEACKEVGISPRYVVAEKAPSEEDLSISDLVKETGEEDLFHPAYLGDSEKLVAAILSSSGTTGMPKAVCVSHANLIDRKSYCKLNITNFYATSSLGFAPGLLGLLFVPFGNATRYLSIRQFTPELFFDMVENFKLTYLSTTPDKVADIMKSPMFTKVDLSSLKCLFVHSGSFSVEMRKAAQERFPTAKLVLHYGGTEFGFVASNDSVDVARNASVGMLTSNVEAKILNDDGSQLGINEPGVLWIKNPVRALGYLNNQAATDEIISPDGWICTGDVCYFDEDGYLFVVDRKKEILRYMNHPVAPAEVERTIEQLPEVQHVCVVGMFDAVQQTNLATAVIKINANCSLSERHVIEHVGSNLADYKHLHGGVFFVDEMPMTRTGKIKRIDVKRIAEQRAAAVVSRGS